MSQMTGIGALERLGEQFANLEESPPRRRPTGRTLLIAAVVLAVVIAASLTPPGRAVAGKIGELVGIGDEPTNVGGEAVVIGVGEGSGGRYEIFASTQLPNALPSDHEVTCIGLNVPDSHLGVQSASCLTEDQKPFLEREILNPIAKPAPKELGLEGETVVQGLARSDVASVELEHRGPNGELTHIPVEFFSLDEELGDEIGSEEDVGFFIALVPDALLYGEGELPRRVASGNVAEAAESAFSRLRIRATDQEGSTLVDERYTDLTLPTWWAAVALGSLAALEHGAIHAEPPAMLRKAPKLAD